MGCIYAGSFTTPLLASARTVFSLALAAYAPSVLGQPQQPAQDLPLFAVEIRVGPKWDQAKQPHDQMYFREHSANLKRLRDAGSLVLGARYSDKGLIVITAQSENQVRAMMDEDPSIRAEVFRYEVHPFNVFYAGTVNQKQRPPVPK